MGHSKYLSDPIVYNAGKGGKAAGFEEEKTNANDKEKENTKEEKESSRSGEETT